MKKLMLPVFLLAIGQSYSQEYIDTTFTVRGFTCACKYNINTEDDKYIYNTAGKDGERSAYYPGGDKEWKKFAKENLNREYKGKEKVEVRFSVDKNGNLSAFELKNRAPAQKFEEVVRVLGLSGKWFPKSENGYCVKSYITLSLEL